MEVNLQQGSPQSHIQGPEGLRLPSPTPNPTPLELDPAGATPPAPHPAPAWPPTPPSCSLHTVPYFAVPDGFWRQDGCEFSKKTGAPVGSPDTGGFVRYSQFGKREQTEPSPVVGESAVSAPCFGCCSQFSVEWWTQHTPAT